MRRSSLVLLTILLGLVVLPFPQRSASASCAAPYLTVEPRVVLTRATTVTVEGEAFADGCRDSQSCSETFGCHSCEYDDPPPTPLRQIGLQVVQRGHTWDLGKADAGSSQGDRLGQVSWRIEIPAGAQPGPATLVAEHAQAVPIRLR